MAVDAPGVRSVLATCEEAKKKNLAVVSGLCLRYSYGFRETVQRIHDGAIGDIRTLQATDYRGGIWVKPRQPDWTDMEWQMRNWYYFTWLSGDFNVEQHVHYLDVCTWVMKNEYPVKAVGMGGRQVRTGPEYGNIYDHHSVVYEYANGAKLFSNCRQQPGCYNEMSSFAMGSKGVAEVSERRLAISAASEWKYDMKKPTTFTRQSTTSCLRASGVASRSTMANTWPRARYWRSGSHGDLHRPGGHLGAGHELHRGFDAAEI